MGNMRFLNLQACWTAKDKLTLLGVQTRVRYACRGHGTQPLMA